MVRLVYQYLVMPMESMIEMLEVIDNKLHCQDVVWSRKIELIIAG